MEKYDILVNKDNRLSSFYVPKNLTDIAPTNRFMQEEKLILEAYKNFLKLQQFSKKNGLDIFIASGYRSYIEQSKVYFYYLRKLGLEAAKKRVALPGASEHQTGLALDLGVIENDQNKNITRDESHWLSENATEYGFILRFPEGKEQITGIGYEPWHFRFVGDELADYLFRKGITLEEFHEEKTVKKLKK